MSLLSMLYDERVWRQFYEYKTSLVCHKSFEQELLNFIEKKEYIPVSDCISKGKDFPLPNRSFVNKSGSQKKRVVYTYPEKENIVLKLLTHLLLRKYNDLFADNLYSFRPGRSAKDAVRKLTSLKLIRNMYAYKVDISNYFNSIQMPLFMPMLKQTLSDDTELYEFLSRLLLEKHVWSKGKLISEEKGIMAGTPLASFYANLFLSKLDFTFESRNIPYIRYSDDIIVFAPDMETAVQYADEIKSFLYSMKLKVNPDKENFFSPDEGWTFLGFCCQGGVIDIAPATVKKIKAKMRRKTKSLKRWQKRNDISGEKAAAAFIRIFNSKLLEGPLNNELTWSYWFFPIINITDSLHIIDRYAQDCIRFLVSGVHRKSRFNVRYDDMKLLGYQSLVHHYYEFRRQNKI